METAILGMWRKEPISGLGTVIADPVGLAGVACMFLSQSTAFQPPQGDMPEGVDKCILKNTDTSLRATQGWHNQQMPTAEECLTIDLGLATGKKSGSNK